MNKTITLFVIVLLLGMNTHIFSQNEQEEFQKAVSDYSSACEHLKTAEAKYYETLETADIDKVVTEFKNASNLLLIANSHANIYSEIKTPSAYYAFLCQTKLAFIDITYFGSSEMAYAILKGINSYFNGEKEIVAPFDYSYYGTRYTVGVDNVNSLKISYFQTLGDACYGMGKYDEMLVNYNKLLEFKTVTAFNKAQTLHKLIEVAKLNENIFSSSDYINYLSLFITNYSELSQADKNKLTNDSVVISNAKALNLLVEATEMKPLAGQDIAKITGVINMLANSGTNSVELQKLYQGVINKYLSTNATHANDYDYNLQCTPFQFLTKAESYARVTSNAADLGLLATTKIAELAIINNDCNNMQTAADNFAYWKKPQEAKKYQAMVAPCRAKQKRQEAKRISDAKRANSTFNFYTGIYPFPLFTSNEKRDYGAVINFVNKRSAIEFSYLLIQQKKDISTGNMWKSSIDPLTEMSVWDGYYTHVEYKQFAKDSGSKNYYQGLLLGMATKNFATMHVDVTNNQTNLATNTAFNPTEKQYILMYNFGVMFLIKGFGIDAFLGAGGTYSSFDKGVQIDKNLYTIRNVALQTKNANYYGLLFRLGLTMGLNLGNGNMR